MITTVITTTTTTIVTLRHQRYQYNYCCYYYYYYSCYSSCYHWLLTSSTLLRTSFECCSHRHYLKSGSKRLTCRHCVTCLSCHHSCAHSFSILWLPPKPHQQLLPGALPALSTVCLSSKSMAYMCYVYCLAYALMPIRDANLETHIRDAFWHMQVC